jgi:hypothetical protein
MEALEPIINLLIFLTALSVAAERLTNVIKLRNPDLKDEKATKLTGKEREERITNRGVLTGVALALVLKADLIGALNRLDAPWETLGWVRIHGSAWVWAPEATGVVTAFFAVLGCAITAPRWGSGPSSGTRSWTPCSSFGTWPSCGTRAPEAACRAAKPVGGTDHGDAMAGGSRGGAGGGCTARGGAGDTRQHHGGPLH